MPEAKKSQDNFDVISPIGVAVYTHVWEAFKFKEDEADPEKKARFSIKIVAQKNATHVKELKATVQRAAVAKFGEKVVRQLMVANKFSLPWRATAEFANNEGDREYPFDDDDAQVFSASTNENNPPEIVDERRRPILKQSEFFAGCSARFSAFAYAFDNKGNKGVTLLLHNVQRTGKGEPLGGQRKKPQDEFDDVAGADDTGNSEEGGDLFS